MLTKQQIQDLDAGSAMAEDRSYTGGLQNSIIKTTAPLSEVETELEFLRKLCRRQDDLVGKLSERLGPILRDAPPTPDGEARGGPVPRQQTPLGRNLNEIKLQLMDVSGRLQRLLEGLGV